MTREAPDRQWRPVVFGEVLYDCFADGATVLGGAPFNVAWHLKGLGLDPLLVSRIGPDARGGEVRAAMLAAGLNTAGLQIDPELPTGAVEVAVNDGQPDFEIPPGQAFDAIDAGTAQTAVAGRSDLLLYHGTLVLRAAKSGRALATLRQHTGLPVFLDVNLRAPWWNRDGVDAAMRAARWVKLNVEELGKLTDPGLRPEETAQKLAAHMALQAVIVTRGAAGAFWADADGVLAEVSAAPVVMPADTVGAGDAFSAACIAGLAAGLQPRVLLERAARLAAGVCAVHGAIPDDAGFHARILEPDR